MRPSHARRPRSWTWIFDLDNTLHDASPHVFPHLNRTMTAYLQHHLDLDHEQASRLRRHYWKRYGATLLGLMRHHGTDPHHFLEVTHDFPDLPGMILREPGLRAALRRLPGRKVVFSNSPVNYARAVLGILRIADLFDGVFSIEHTGFRPKPDSAGFLRLLRRHRLQPRGCVMVEDSLENLMTARRLGMKTVWITDRGRSPAYVDVTIHSVRELPAAAAALG
jgi:putative hydrolase of the HAD superfamily